ncbi:MAG: hypothetical protein FH761_05895 [Firmicutes bacterium]|nr:hypothetical protein [Bacillota bacterium]
MSNLEIEKINGYIDINKIEVPNWKVLFSGYFFFLIISIPSALFGKMNVVTKPIMVAWTVIMGVWTLYLFFNKDKIENYVLYLGVISIFISISSLVATYKIVSLIYEVEYYLVLLCGIIYLALIALNVWNTIRLIKNGYYSSTNQSTKNNYGLILATSVLGLGIGRAFLGNVGNEKAIIIIVSVLLFFAFIFLTGSHNILKYYYIHKYKS